MADYLAAHELLVDCILHTGDIADVKNPHAASGAEHDAAEGDVSDMISALENICSRVFYIPGNHDPRALFALTDLHSQRGTAGKERNTRGGMYDHALTPIAVSVQGDAVELADGLWLVGEGGSVDSVRTDDLQTVVYKGFPYSGGDDPIGFKMMLSLQHEVPPGSCVLFATHCGPFGAWTAIDSRPEVQAHMGSRSIVGALEQACATHRVVGVLHGHTHPSPGVCGVDVASGRSNTSVTVSNCGSLMEGRFSVVRLARDPKIENAEWMLANIKHFDLNEVLPSPSHGDDAGNG